MPAKGNLMGLLDDLRRPELATYPKYIKYTGTAMVGISVRMLEETRTLLTKIATDHNMSVNEYVKLKLGIHTTYGVNGIHTDEIKLVEETQ